MLEYPYKGCVLGTRKQILSMAINGSGISDTSRVLKVSKGTVISAIARQEDQLVSVNPNIAAGSRKRYDRKNPACM